MICPKCDQEKEVNPTIICYLGDKRICNDCYNAMMWKKMIGRINDPKRVRWFRLF